MSAATIRAGTSIDAREIQGNVLRGYGPRLPHATYLSIAVRRSAAGRRLLDLLRPHVTAHDWKEDPPASALNIAISYRGLKHLGVPEHLLASFPPEFAAGMEARAERLRDVGRSSPDTWESGLRRIEILVSLHAIDAQRLLTDYEWLVNRIRTDRGVDLAAAQPASILAGAREHFGYADGFGQPTPAIAARDAELGHRVAWRAGRTIALGEFVHGYRDEDDQLATAPAPPFDRNGTFMVFRKLAQDVRGFRQLLAEIAANDFSGDKELAAAKLAGRWRDGTPLIRRPPGRHRPALLPSERNEFDYHCDPHGYMCPLGAHIRRANPRDGLPGGYTRTRRHRIIRRGMPYGMPLPDHGPDPDPNPDPAKRGLLFVCFNASIARQFEVVNGWLNDGTTFGLGRDADVLAGTPREDSATLMSIQGEPPVLIPTRQLVWTRGGEYLFVPSRRALGALAEGRWDD